MSFSSFILTRFPVPASLFEKIRTPLAGLNDKQRHFVLHVLVSNVINLNKIRHHALEGWLEVGIDLTCQWVAEHFGEKFDVKAIDPRIVSFTTHSKGQCRTFKAADHLLNLILGWAPQDMAEAASEPLVNLFDGTPHRVRVPKEWEGETAQSTKSIRDAIKVFTHCPFNYTTLAAHLRQSEARFLHETDPEDREHLERVFRNDNACATRIRAGCTPTTNGMAGYQPEYRTIYTGRIVETGGGCQSCSREMKAAMFKDVPGLKNLDLKRAQAFILLQELEDAGLPRDWTEGYVHATEANEVMSAALGMSKDAYKQCLYATIMGAVHSKFWNKDKNDIYRCLLKECDGNSVMARELALKVYGALSPLKVEVDAWHDHLMKAAACRHVDPVYKKVRALQNACGQHFKLEGERADRLARRAAAFILQGQEAAFVHRLTVLGKDHGFLPISNQYDGLVVIGDIPKVAIDLAKESSGLRYAELEEKAFV